MRFALLLGLMVVFGVLNRSDAWAARNRYFWETWRYNPRWYSDLLHQFFLTGKRDVSQMDTNLDGLLDQSELETFMSKRDAKEFLETAADGDSAITMAQFEELFRNLRELEDDEV